MATQLFAKSGPEWTPLFEHLEHVAMTAEKFAKHFKMDIEIARKGAILHDIGKAHPAFQKRLMKQRRPSDTPFRHEIASLFFLSMFPENIWAQLIEMVVGHHKSVKNDAGKLGLLDLEEECEYINFHLGKWDEWSVYATELLFELGVSFKSISRQEALNNLDYCIEYCERKTKERGYSEWKGLLMGADHFASALVDKTESYLSNVFIKPNLSFYNRAHELYPLSLMDASSNKQHTIVVASTGAGKTDYLFRRCKGRVFYTLPFQASINAMFKRVGSDLENENPNLDIRVLHSTSKVVKRKENEEESVLQSLMGSSIKILTPHQLSALAFGMNGYEALLLDLKGCDVILDEVHTYSGISQAIVLKLVEVLAKIKCRIHIGTATMPTILYQRIKNILGNDVLEINLSDEEKDKFDRHICHKLNSFDEAKGIIYKAVVDKQKVLIVLNTVKEAQQVYEYIKEEDKYRNIPTLLLHSRFKRSDRNEKEKQLIGIGEDGNPLYTFNTSSDACIVISTQIVEVSLDISFDVMITECAPLDALIQRFGRINRKRSLDTIGHLKPVYIIATPADLKTDRPYNLEILKKSFEVLDDNKPIRERDIQKKIDDVFTSIDFLNIEEHSVFKTDGRVTIDYLTHKSKAILFDLLQIDSVSCILESDVYEYENGDFESRLLLEIPTYYYAVSKMRQSSRGNNPFIIPDASYCPRLGLNVSKINQNTGVII